MKILLLGSQGQLGWELQRSLAPLGGLMAYGHHRGALSSPGSAIDLTDTCALAALVQHTAPDLIVNAAAYTALDAAEREPDAAWAVNAIAPGVLAQAAQAQGARLLHFSTDCVFAGLGSVAQGEDDTTEPLSAYGRSKLEGERRVRAACAQHLILRTSWLHSAHRPGFMQAVLQRAAHNETVLVVDDQIGAPTSAAWLADAAAQLLPTWMAQAPLAGTYHATAAGAVSRLVWARATLAAAHQAGWLARRPGPATAQAAAPLAAQGAAPVLEAISSERYAALYPGTARRPLNSRLDCTRLSRCFGITPPDWQLGVQQVLAELSKQKIAP